MTVTLNVEREKFLEETVASGRYATTNEAVEAAFDLFEERERKLAALRFDIDQGLEDLEAGRYVELSPEDLPQFFAKIRNEPLA
ncbi:MAG: type II toxin-antitoxin system ParD family antitoxin [Bryobacteraceae bacterium]|nr:type II toxin-antitoxin system ParD family antitoxin [Bryobacteraceae bacterium]